MLFMQEVSKNHQFTVCHRKELYTTLYVPGGTIQSLLEETIGLVNAGCFVSALDVCIPIRMKTIVKIGNDTILVDLGNRCCEQIKPDKPKNL